MSRRAGIATFEEWKNLSCDASVFASQSEQELKRAGRLKRSRRWSINDEVMEEGIEMAEYQDWAEDFDRKRARRGQTEKEEKEENREGGRVVVDEAGAEEVGGREGAAHQEGEREKEGGERGQGGGRAASTSTAIDGGAAARA